MEVAKSLGLIASYARYSHAELEDHVQERAMTLAGQRRPRWLVADRSIQTAVTILAALRSNTPLALIHPKLTVAERATLKHRINLATLPADAAIVIFTSGTTGEPKGVVLSQRAFAASAAGHGSNLGWKRNDRWLCCLSLAHIGGLSILTRCATAASCVVLSPEAPFSARAIVDTIVAERVTLLSVVPTMLDRLLDDELDWQPPATLRAVLLGGAKASPELVSRAIARGVPVLTTYGMSETCSQIYTGGTLLDGVELRSTDGHLQVRGPMLASGYLDQRGFAPLTDDDGWFDTADLGHVDATGKLHISGRDDDCIITGGANVAPAEVERALEASPQVATACVFGVADETWGQIVAAAIVPANSDLKRLQLAEFLGDRLAAYKLPRRLCVIDEFPVGNTGKVDRRRIIDMTRERLQPWR